MGMHDAVDFGTSAIDPGLEAIGRIGYPVTGDDGEVLIDVQEIRFGNLIESEPETLRVEVPGCSARAVI